MGNTPHGLVGLISFSVKVKTNPERMNPTIQNPEGLATTSNGVRQGIAHWWGIFKNPLVRAGLVLGMGFGGLADGIILHQILGWHHLVCYSAQCVPTSVAQLEHENTQDGYFHLGLWLGLLAGTAMLLGAARQGGPDCRGRVLLGGMLAGSGIFNFFEGLLNHQILGIHHVLPGDPHQFLYDMLYLANGWVFFFAGVWLARPQRLKGKG
jgi:uncharacterized membrane protein